MRYVQSNHAVSERRSCAVLTFDRRSVRYRSVRADHGMLLQHEDHSTGKLSFKPEEEIGETSIDRRTYRERRSAALAEWQSLAS